MHHLLQLRARDLLLLCARLFVDELRLLDHVSRAEQQHAIARQSIASGASGFLVVALDVFRQIVVDDVADVRFVDAHAECDRRADDAHFITQKKLLVRRALSTRKSGVIRPGLDAVFVQTPRYALR